VNVADANPWIELCAHAQRFTSATCARAGSCTRA
jgi:hypothetical protein